jgi:hypothetical protein
MGLDVPHGQSAGPRHPRRRANEKAARSARGRPGKKLIVYELVSPGVRLGKQSSTQMLSRKLD